MAREVKQGEVLESRSVPGVDGGTMLMQLELIVVKNRSYAYWYAYQRVDHRLFRVYVGQQIQTNPEGKGRQRLREKIRKYDPC